MGIGDWGLGIGPNPQSPIPNPLIILVIYNTIQTYYIKIDYIIIEIKYFYYYLIK